jgi:type VI secretion system protein ImpA
MNELIEKLLQPISPEQPCGPDLSYDGRFDELETLLRGKPEIDTVNIKKPAEPPDWRQLQEKSAAFLKQSKDLRAAMMLCCSLLKTGGLTGFRDGLQLIRGLIEQYWNSLYPLLDPEDGNDPTYRLNILGALTAPRGSVTGWLAIIDGLYAAPLCQPKGAPAVTFEQLNAAKLRQSGAEAAPAEGPALANLTPLLRASADGLALQHQALQEALEAMRLLDQFLATTLTAHKSMSFEELEKVLQAMLTAIEPFLPSGENQTETGAAQAGSQEGAGAGDGSIIVRGAIRSREDVVTALESICQYYDQVEPGSPVPFLLRRAQKLARMNFVEAVQELNLIAGLDALRPSMGSVIEGESSAPPPPPAE